MRDFIFTITLSFSLLFFSIFAIAGMEYAGIAESHSYVLSVLGCIVLSLIFIFGKRFLKKIAPIRKINLLFYLLPFFTLLIYLIELPSDRNSKQSFIIYLAFSSPAIYIGTYVAANKYLTSMAKWWDLVNIFITWGLIVSFSRIVFSRAMGGLSYQYISYMAAFAFSLSLFSILFGDKYRRFKICKSKIYTLIIYFLMPFQFICVFASNGRGGIVLLILSSVILLYVKSKEHFKLGKVILATISISIILIILSNILPQEIINAMKNGYERIISEVSGRAQGYSVAWRLIKERPLYGYGIFNYVHTFNMYVNDVIFPYPHNLFLEFLLQGGMIYLFFWIFLLVTFYIKFKRILKVDNSNLLLIPISLFPFTELLFSGSYLMSPLFWFSISYIFSYKIRKSKYSEIRIPE